ncbi:MAG: pyridoxamine 5'-phosphate oxidase family protein [Ilumatobacteraceae bacterium]
MTRFQLLAVVDRHGPHVTLAAGAKVGGRHWSTTSVSAAKVRALRRNPRAGVLSIDADGHGWSLVVGRATILDPRRPFDGLADPAAVSLAGMALTRLGLANADQIVGYLRDGASVPNTWRPPSRVLIAVRAEHRLTWRNGVVADATGQLARSRPLPRPTRQRRHRVDPAVAAGVESVNRALVTDAGTCTVGFTTPLGPVAVPGWWDPSGTVRIDRNVLCNVPVDLPGPCCVTIDDSHDARPSAKRGVMLRCVAGRLARGDEHVDLAVRVESAISWHGFDATTRRAG